MMATPHRNTGDRNRRISRLLLASSRDHSNRTVVFGQAVSTSLRGCLFLYQGLSPRQNYHAKHTLWYCEYLWVWLGDIL
ncbi:hypothetical protein PCAR4_570208 [Paraburkholderia caribensis]|nr:hypothetical protein PCAR4_570208 [Paraburkholderia caribensis]